MSTLCPRCQNPGRRVSSETLRALVRPDALPATLDAWSFCAAPDCDAVYFDQRGDMLPEDALAVRVGIKCKEPPHPICYCFGHSLESIQDEVQRTGASSAFSSIKAEVEGGNCSCETKNPKGSCCLADVRRAESAALGQSSMAPDESMTDCRDTKLPARPRSRKGFFAVSGALVAALGASACCWLPLILVALGVSSVGVSAFFVCVRPWFLGVSVLLLGTGFYLAYRPGPRCAPGEVCRVQSGKSLVFRKGSLWVAAAFVIVVGLFPNWVGLVAPPEGEIAVETSENVVHLTIEGMDCAACSLGIESQLESVPGVSRARVDYETSSADVVISRALDPDAAQLIEAVENAGFEAHVHD